MQQRERGEKRAALELRAASMFKQMVRVLPDADAAGTRSPSLRGKRRDKPADDRKGCRTREILTAPLGWRKAAESHKESQKA